MVKIFNYEDGENIGALQFRLKDDLTAEMKENLKGNEYMSFSFEDMVKTKARTYSFGEIGFPDWNPDMGEVIVPGCKICKKKPLYLSKMYLVWK